MTTRTKATRSDGLVNLFTGLGVAGRDKSVANRFAPPTFLTFGELETIYRTCGLARRIINLPVDQMVREWFKVDGDTEGAALGYLEELHAKAALADALRWADLFGGSLVMLGLDDGQKDPAEPLDEGNLRAVTFFRVYDRQQVTWTTGDLYTDPTEPLFNEPQWYTVTPSFGGSMFRLHESRTLKFKGAPVPPRAERELQGWGDSMLQAVDAELKQNVAAIQHVMNIIEDFRVGALTIENLIPLLSRKDGEAEVKKRLDVIDYGKSILRSLLLSKGESFEWKTSNISGIAEILDRLAQRLSAVCATPVTLLFGEPPSGLRATGKSNREDWFDEISGRQETKLLQPLERLVRYCYIAKDGPTKGVEPDNWGIVFNPLDQPTEVDEATLRKTQSDTDVAYINAGVLEPSEVAISRFGGERYSTDTTIDESLHSLPTAADVEAKANTPPPLPPGANGGTPPPALPGAAGETGAAQ